MGTSPAPPHETFGFGLALGDGVIVEAGLIVTVGIIGVTVGCTTAATGAVVTVVAGVLGGVDAGAADSQTALSPGFHFPPGQLPQPFSPPQIVQSAPGLSVGFGVTVGVVPDLATGFGVSVGFASHFAHPKMPLDPY